MALNYDSISAIVRDKYLPTLQDQVFKGSAALALLNLDSRIKPGGARLETMPVGGGTKIIQPLEYGEGNAQYYSFYDTIDVTPPEIITAAQYVLRNIAVPISISQDEELQVDGADLKVIDLLDSKMENARKTKLKQLGNDFYTGGANSLQGLDTAIGTATYGGIAGASYSWWQSGVDATAHTASNMKDSTSDIAESIAASDQRFTKPTAGSRGEAMANLGFSVLMWRNIPLIVDRYISTASYPMYMGNFREGFTLYYHPKNYFKMSNWVESTNQMARVAKISCTLQSAISNRRMFYRWSDLNN
jgi:hypothetical protein